MKMMIVLMVSMIATACVDARTESTKVQGAICLTCGGGDDGATEAVYQGTLDYAASMYPDDPRSFAGCGWDGPHTTYTCEVTVDTPVCTVYVNCSTSSGGSLVICISGCH